MRGKPPRIPAGKLRIIAGHLRGSRLTVPDLPGLRPTPERVRETLFNWLMPVIEGAHCLDLFAGSGALGLEALSRGAAQGVFVERDARLAALLRENLARLRLDNGRVVAQDAASFLATPAQPFDIVFLDPPFAGTFWNDAAAALEAWGWLRESAWIYLESPPAAELVLPAQWALHRAGHAGDVHFALYRRGAGIR